MATQAQIIANKANSQKSSGAVTDEGKAKSSRNRLSQGFASSTRFIEGEKPEPFNALLNDLFDEHQPATPPQQILVEMMAHNRWDQSPRSPYPRRRTEQIMYKFREVAPTLPLLIRYHTTADRAFHKAHAEPVKAQKQRPNREIGFES